MHVFGSLTQRKISEFLQKAPLNIFSLLNNVPTAYGFLALALWATASTAICFLKNIPPFQLAMMVFLINAVLTFLKISFKREWTTLNIPLSTWILVIAGIGLQQVFYIVAYHLAPPTEIDTLIYLWPLIAICVSCLILKDKFKITYAIASLLGLTAVLVLSYGKVSLSTFNIGHICALCCALTWGLYTVLMRNRKNVGINIIGLSYLPGAILAFFLHTSFEQFVFPTLNQLLILIYYSTVISLGGYVLWTKGVQRGHANCLALSAYMKPVASILLLCSFGFATLNIQIALAVCLVATAGLVCNDFVFSYLKHSFNSALQGSSLLLSRS